MFEIVNRGRRDVTLENVVFASGDETGGINFKSVEHSLDVHSVGVNWKLRAVCHADNLDCFHLVN